MNFLQIDYQELGAGDTTVMFKEYPIQVPVSVQDFDGSIDVGVRPEHIGLSREAGGISALVVASEYLGTTQIVSVQVDQTILKARVSSSEEYALGSAINLYFDPRNISLFNHHSGKALLSEGNQEVLING